MKKLLPILILCGIFAVVVPVLADVVIPDPLDGKTIGDIIASIINLIAGLATGIGVIMIIWAGILYMTAGSSEEKVTKAKKTILWTIVGLAIIWSANFIVDAIVDLVKGP